MTGDNGQIVWLDTHEVCKQLGLKNRSVLDGWAQKRKGPSFYRIGTRRLYDQRDVTAWLRAQRVETRNA